MHYLGRMRPAKTLLFLDGPRAYIHIDEIPERLKEKIEAVSIELLLDFLFFMTILFSLLCIISYFSLLYFCISSFLTISHASDTCPLTTSEVCAICSTVAHNSEGCVTTTRVRCSPAWQYPSELHHRKNNGSPRLLEVIHRVPRSKCHRAHHQPSSLSITVRHSLVTWGEPRGRGRRLEAAGIQGGVGKGRDVEGEHERAS